MTTRWLLEPNLPVTETAKAVAVRFPTYIQGLRATHYVCVVRLEGSPVAVLSLPSKRVDYEDAKVVFVNQVKNIKRQHDGHYSVSFYG